MILGQLELYFIICFSEYIPTTVINKIGETVEDILESFKIQKLKFPPHNFSKNAIEFIINALEIDPKKRIEVYEMINHKWFKEDTGFGSPNRKEVLKEDIKFDDFLLNDNSNSNKNTDININTNSDLANLLNANPNQDSQKKSFEHLKKSVPLTYEKLSESKNRSQNKEYSPQKVTSSPSPQIKLTSNKLVNAILLEKASENQTTNSQMNTNIQEKINAKQHYLSQTLKAKSTRFLISKNIDKESKVQKAISPFDPNPNPNSNSPLSPSAAKSKNLQI